MKCSYILLFFVFGWQACLSQNIEPCKDTIEVDIENSALYDKESIIKDSMLMKIQIVFEQNFDDTIYIFCDNKLVQSKKITTNRTLGVCPEVIDIDYSKFKKTPKVSILVGLKKDCISFYPKRGKRIVYVNYINGAWSVELSNAFREYR